MKTKKKINDSVTHGRGPYRSRLDKRKSKSKHFFIKIDFCFDFGE